jgi:hypothetical protein
MTPPPQTTTWLMSQARQEHKDPVYDRFLQIINGFQLHGEQVPIDDKEYLAWIAKVEPFSTVLEKLKPQLIRPNLDWVEIDLGDPRVYGSGSAGATIPDAEFYRVTNKTGLDAIGNHFLKWKRFLRIDFSQCHNVNKIGDYFLCSCPNFGKSDRLNLPPPSMKGLQNVTVVGVRPFFQNSSLSHLDHATAMPNVTTGGADAFINCGGKYFPSFLRKK